MWWVLVVLVAGAGASHGAGDPKVNITCRSGGGSDVEVLVTAAEDAVPARYQVHYCVPRDPRITRWVLNLDTISQPQQNCTYESLGQKYSGVSHSHVVEKISLANLTCSHVCVSRPMDLMFRTCYRITNQLLRGKITSKPTYKYFFADNNVTKFTRDPPGQFVNEIDYDTAVSFHWYEGQIPITGYKITVWPNNTDGEDMDVSNNCTHEAHSLHCVLHLPYGCYDMRFNHEAPWTKGYGYLASYDTQFCHMPPTLPAQALPLSRAVWWACGAALACACAALATLVTWRARRAAKTRLRVLRHWRDRTAEAAESASPAASAACGPVLLLYAAECAAGAALAGALVNLLRATLPSQVYDLYSPEVTALAARSPAGWVRGCLAAPSVRVVLLQTPALAALHTLRTGGSPHAVNLEEPLIPRGALYRRPQFADTLLQYALQLIGETAHAQPTPPYRKYFLVTVSELAVDVLPSVVPYARFPLPGAAPGLLRALHAPAQAPAAALAELAAASAALARYVKDNPGYLADQLLFL